MRTPLLALPQRSLGWRILAIVIFGEVLFAVVLGFTIGAYSVRSVAQQRQDSIQQLSGFVAASLMPMVADQQEPQVRAQIQSILEVSGAEDIECIRVVDSTGATIASAGGANECETKNADASSSLVALLSTSQTVRQPVTIDGLQVADVYVGFAPPGILASLRAPGIAAGIVLVSVILVSVPWTAWLFMRSVVEPLGELQDSAARIAEGDLDVDLSTDRVDEIGQLQRALSAMAAEIKDRNERLSQSYEDLSSAYQSLERAKAEIEEMAELKSDFVAVAAHELRTPLAVIRLYAEMLEQSEMGQLSEPGLDAVAAIGSASTRLTSIVSDLMDSALLERGVLPLEFGDVWVDELVLRAVTDADLSARVRGMQVVLEGDTPNAIVRGDALRLRQVLDNLLSNAIKYSSDGSVVSVRARRSDAYIEVEVVDRGIGIAAEDGPKLFQLFGRLDSKDSRDTAGLGLGLAISARIMDAHGGHISFRANEEGKGSVFLIRVPNRTTAGGPSNAAVQVVGRRET